MLKSNLLKLKKDLEKKLKREVPWEEISEETGISPSRLKALATTKSIGVTNTAYVEALCRYFKCDLHELLKLSPGPKRKHPCHVDEIRGGRPKAADDGDGSSGEPAEVTNP